jgi:quercetin dioxygenase-like cupin family protein
MAEEETSNQTDPETEYLSKYIARIEDALKGHENQPVILSTDLPNYVLGQGAVTRVPILWRLYEHSMFYITTIEAGTDVGTHCHPENVFRYVIEGAIDIVVEGRSYQVSQGRWILVRANTNYSLVARSNPHVKVFSAYQYTCKVN